MSISISDNVSNAIRPCEAILYPVILIVSAVLYSEIIDSITDEEMKASASVVLCGAILCILMQCAITEMTIIKTIRTRLTTILTAITTLHSEKILTW